MKLERVLFETVIAFGVGILILTGVVLYQDNTIQNQRVLIKKLYDDCHHPVGEVFRDGQGRT